MRAEPDAGPPVFDAGSADDRNEVEPGELCARVAAVQCASEAYCCEKPGRTFAQCATLAKKSCVDNLELDRVAMESVSGFDANKTKAVLDELEDYAKSCDPAITSWGASVEGLRAILQGTRDEGDNCAPRSNSTLAYLGAAGLVSCKEPETYACQPRGTIKGGKLDWTCDERSDEDGECFSDMNCKDGLYCDNPDGNTLASCKPRKALGDACAYAHECESYACEDEKCVPLDVQGAYCLSFE